MKESAVCYHHAPRDHHHPVPRLHAAFPTMRGFAWQEGYAALPGQILLVAVDAEEPAGKPVAECEKHAIPGP